MKNNTLFITIPLLLVLVFISSKIIFSDFLDVPLLSQLASVSTSTSTTDTKKPTTPGKPVVSGSPAIGTILSWTPSTDNVGVIGYNVFRNNKKVGIVVEPKYIDTSLIVGTTYTFKVSAYDKAGNTSNLSQGVSFKITKPYNPPATTTPPVVVTDTIPPTLKMLSPLNGVTMSGTFVVAVEAKDNVGIASVKMWRDDGISLGTFTATSSDVYSVYLEPSQIGYGSHTFYAQAVDTSGNITDDPNTITTAQASFSNGLFTATFGGVPGKSYNILKTTNLSEPRIWSIVATKVAGIDGTIPFSEPLTGSMAFYKIEEVSSVANGLNAYWNFENVSGTTVPDASGNNRLATLVGAPSVITGLKGNSLELIGSGAYVNVPSIPNLTQFSISAWVNPSASQSGWESVVIKQNRYGLEMQSGRVYANIGDGTTSWRNTVSAPLSSGVWHHVVQSYDGTNNRLYIDGVLSASGVGALINPTSDLLLGSWNGTSEYFNGKLDEIRIYNRAITSTEVQTLYTSITPPTPPPATPTATLTASPNSIIAGSVATLTWASTNATSCTGTGGAFAGNKSPSGSVQISPTITTSYSITCVGAGGNSNIVNVTVTVETGGGTGGIVCEAVVADKCRYVDGTLTTGLNNGTSWVNAWRSFDNIVWGTNGVGAGNTLYISGGNTSKTYSNKYIIVGASGTANAPITIRPGQDVGHNGLVIFDYSGGGTNNSTEYAVDQRNTNYIVWDGEYQGVSHIKFQNLRNILARHIGRTFYNSGGDNHTYRYITFNNMNNGISEGVRLAEYNRFELMAGDYSINATHNSTQAFDQIIIRNNFIESAWNNAVAPGGSGNWTGPDGIWADTGVTVYNNIFKSTKVNYYTSDQHTDYLQTTGNYVKVFNNEFINIGDSAFDYGVYANTPNNPHDIWIYNNLFRTTDLLDPYPEYFRFYGYGSAVTAINNLKILNNTFADSTGYMMMRFDTFMGNPTASGVEIKNNIFQNIDSTIINIANSTGFDSSSFSFGNNIYSPSSSGGINYRGVSYTIPTWISGVDISSKSVAPMFSSYTAMNVNNDFHLLGTDTGAQNAGANLSAHCSTVGGSQLCKDKDGNTRPSAGAWDIGAYEYIAPVVYGNQSNTANIFNTKIELTDLIKKNIEWFTGLSILVLISIGIAVHRKKRV